MAGELIQYQTEDGVTVIRLQASDGNVWLSQADMADLFQSTKQSISLHIRNILDEGELEEVATVKENLTVQTEGKRQVSRQISYYSLPMIMAVGFRVRSARGGQFRRWAAEQLSEYLVKGFVMDDARLKDPEADYFEELLARIRDIRASEKLFYKKVLDIYATAVDYDPRAEASQQFFQTVQNKMHHAAHGQTAAETKVARAHAAKPMMGLTSWPGEKRGTLPTRADAQVAKNYLKPDEMETLMDFMVATAAEAQISKFGLRVGDVLITKDSETPDDIAIPSYVASTAPDLVCGYHLAIIRPRSGTDGLFLKFYFEHPHTRHFFASRANGATRFGLTIDAIQTASIALPSYDEQKRIGEVIGAAELEIARLHPIAAALRQEKAALMQQLLTGKRRAKVEDTVDA